MLIIINLNSKKLYFNENDILSILDKFDLSLKNKAGNSFYDIINIYNSSAVLLFSNNLISTLVSKIDVESTDYKNKNILIKELENGLKFDSDKLIQKY